MTSGERWSAEELEALLAGRFSPAATARFLRASFRRANDTRRARPQLARQARVWSLVGLLSALAGSMAAARARRAAPTPCRFALWWLLTAAMLDWHLGMVEGPDGESRERLSAADALTLQRLWLVPLLAAQGDPARGSDRAFAVLIAWAGASDLLDGALARRAGPTRLGRDLDKVSDALVVAAAARAAGRAGWLPTLTVRLALIRSGAPVAYAAASYFRTGRRPLVDSLGAGRRLAPALLGGLAVAPFAPRLGASLTSMASVVSLALVLVAPTEDDGIALGARSEKRSSLLGQVSAVPHKPLPRVPPSSWGRLRSQVRPLRRLDRSTVSSDGDASARVIAGLDVLGRLSVISS